MPESNKYEESEVMSAVWSCAILDFVERNIEYLKTIENSCLRPVSAVIISRFLADNFRNVASVPDGIIEDLSLGLSTAFSLGLYVGIQGAEPKITNTGLHRERLTKYIKANCSCRGCALSKEVLNRLGIEFDSTVDGAESDTTHMTGTGLSTEDLGDMLSKIFGGKHVSLGEGMGMIIKDLKEGDLHN